MSSQTSPVSADHEALVRCFPIFSGFFAHLPLALYYSRIQNNRWIVQFLSDGITRLLGYKKEDIVGRMGFDDLIVDNEFYKTMPIRSGYKTGEFSYLYTLMTVGRQPKRVIDKGVFLFDENGELNGAAGVIMDFTLESDFDILEYLPAGPERRQGNHGALDQIIGVSPPMKKVIERILKIAPTQGHVLIQGESGTGKELTARAIHELSRFSNRSFIAINCGAISENLMESEFFGHVKGAFSGANETRKGYLDVVDKGTLFLDEVGEMPVNMQIKLLRVLDGYGYAPVGSTRVKNSSFRLICATNRDLESSVSAGIMRLDFYHRIKQLTITLPPLRERKADLDLLIKAFAERYYSDNQIVPPTSQPLAEEALERFRSYHWPGNVRELHHAVIKYLSMGEIEFSAESGPDPERRAEPPAAPAPLPPAGNAPETFEDFERARLLKALNNCAWDTTGAARMLGITQRTVQRKIQKYKLK